MKAFSVSTASDIPNNRSAISTHHEDAAQLSACWCRSPINQEGHFGNRICHIPNSIEENVARADSGRGNISSSIGCNNIIVDFSNDNPISFGKINNSCFFSMNSNISSSNNDSISINSNNNNNESNGSTGVPKKADQSVRKKGPDNQCISCSGLTYFSSQLRKEGKPPVCFGFKTTSKNLIPEDRMRSLDRVPHIGENMKIFQIGISQASVRMNSKGKVPILIFGFEITSEEQPLPEAQNPNVPPNYPGSELRPQQQQQPTSNLFYSLSGQILRNEANMMWESMCDFSQLFKSSSQRQLASSKKLYAQLTDNLPRRLQSSAQRLATSAQNRAKAITRKVLYVIFGTRP